MIYAQSTGLSKKEEDEEEEEEGEEVEEEGEEEEEENPDQPGSANVSKLLIFQVLDRKTTQMNQKQIRGLASHLIFHRFSPLNR